MAASANPKSLIDDPELPLPAEFNDWDGSEISLIALWAILGAKKRAILGAVALATLTAIPVVFLLPIVYRAEAVILTPQAAQSSLSTMAQTAGLGLGAGLPNLSLLSGFVRNPTDLYIAILESRTIADDLIQQFSLKAVYGRKDLIGTRKLLARNTSIESGKDSLIHIRVEDRNPLRAAALANAYVEQLAKQNSQLVSTEAGQRRVFFERELGKEKDALADAEIELKNTEQSTGLVAPSGQAEALIRSATQLRAAVVSRQAQMEAMKAYAAPENPQLQILQREIRALQRELAKVDGNTRRSGATDVSTGQLPNATLQYLRKFRDVKYHETLFEVLAKQYEAARLDEAKSAPVIQVLDRAVVPEKKWWPPRGILIASVSLLSVFFSCCWVLFAYQWRRNTTRYRMRYSR